MCSLKNLIFGYPLFLQPLNKFHTSVSYLDIRSPRDEAGYHLPLSWKAAFDTIYQHLVFLRAPLTLNYLRI